MIAPSKEIYGVVGNPISQSLSPILQNAWIEQHGFNAVYERFEPTIEDFEKSVLNLFSGQLRGCNITSPFKNRAAQICNKKANDVAIMGAANTLRIDDCGVINAINTDGSGLVLDFDKRVDGWREFGQTINIIGAGGAAAGILPALIETHVKQINIIARKIEKATELIEKVKQFDAAAKVEFNSKPWEYLGNIGSDADIIINATTIGLKGNGTLELDLSKTPDHAIVYDMVYSPQKTALLKSADAQKRKAIGGLGMLVGQAVFAFEYWFGVAPDFSYGLDLLEEQLKC